MHLRECYKIEVLTAVRYYISKICYFFYCGINFNCFYLIISLNEAEKIALLIVLYK